MPRPMISYIQKNRKDELVGIEIGVWKGKNALSILQNLNIKRLYLIDPYKPFIAKKNNYKDPTESKIEAHDKLKEYKNKIIFIEKTSDEAVHLIKEQVDFVYIDGLHKYKYVSADIKNYYPLVKKGGVLGGHDFCLVWRGLMIKVISFAIANFKYLHKKEKDWWVVK